MNSNSFDRLAAAVFADESLAASLAALADPAGFTVHALRLAGDRGLALDPADIAETGNDLLGLSRWSPPRLAGRTVPPRHWLPIQVNAGAVTTVDWAWLDRSRSASCSTRFHSADADVAIRTTVPLSHDAR